jgi:hypothetical protein
LKLENTLHISEAISASQGIKPLRVEYEKALFICCSFLEKPGNLALLPASTKNLNFLSNYRTKLEYMDLRGAKIHVFSSLQRAVGALQATEFLICPVHRT